MPIKKYKALSPDPFINKIPGDTEFARLAHLNNLVDQINAQTTPSTNIYNSNGTLTGNRLLNGNNNTLFFQNLDAFGVQTVSDNSITVASTALQFGSNLINNIFLLIDTANKSIYTNNSGSNVGLNLDFANRRYEFGQGQTIGNRTTIEINDNSQRLQTYNNGFVNGIGFEYSTNIYRYGYISGTNTTYFEIDGNNKIIKTNYNLTNQGININLLNKVYSFGQITGNNATTLYIDDTNQIIKTSNQGNDIGLKLDFANNFFDFGYNINEGVFRVNKSGVNTFFQTIYNLEIKGLYFNFTANQFDFGRKNGGNSLQIKINDAANRIFVESLNNNVGINLSINSRLYQFGQITGSNQTTITIDDAAAYPVQLTGTNISSGTAGAASGQFLKIKVGGVDYKIALLNP